MDTLVALAIFLMVQEVLRRWNTKALSLLSVEDRIKIVDGSTKVSIYERAPVVVLLLGFAGLMYLKPSTLIMSIGLTAFVVLLAISTFVSRHINHKRLCTLGLPESYTKQQGRANIVQNLCMAVFFVWILGSYFWEMQSTAALLDAALK